MKIDTRNLLRYRKIYGMTKVVGNIYFSYVFLDFEKKLLSYQNETTIVSIDLIIEGENEKEKNLFVDGEKFFYLVQKYESLEVRDSQFFTPDGHRMILPSIDEEMELPQEVDGDWNHVSFLFDKALISNLSVASSYLEKELDMPALFFDKGKMFILSSIRYFQADSGLDEEKTFLFPKEIVSMLKSIGLQDGDSAIVYYQETSNGGLIVEVTCGTLHYRHATSSQFEPSVDPLSEDFKENFLHEDYVVFPVKEINRELTFLSALLKDFVSPTCNFSFEEDGENLSLRIIIQNNIEVEKLLPILRFSDKKKLVDRGFWILLDSMSMALRELHMKGVSEAIIRYDEEASTIFLADPSEEEKFFLVHALVEDPTV